MKKHRAHAPATTRSRGSQRGGTLLGVAIGFALGVAVAGLIAFALTKSSNPFDGKSGRITDPAAPHVGSGEPAKTGEPKFDFSKILPGIDTRRGSDASTDKADKPDKGGEKSAGVVPPSSATAFPASGATASTPAEKSGKFYLQAGAYQNAADAEDQRAKLALMGIEATLQPVSVPDKGTLNRVRLGPYDSADDMNQVKTELTKRGIATAVIKGP